MTPLHKAVQQGREATVRLLLGLGADRDVRDKHDKRPLDYATNDTMLTALH
jgi:ankyrin repeat protein